jgi:multiple sugar transport system permease protein/sn-glycerol 3-phosphate transport system permease protein
MNGHRLIRFIASIAIIGALTLPFYWMVITALQPPEARVTDAAAWWPAEWRWSNFADAWNAAPFARFFVNSLFTGIAATAIQVFGAILMGYAFAVIRCPGKPFLIVAVIATMAVPEEAKLVPNFLLMRDLGWIDSYWALIIPPAAHAFPVFVMYQQFRTIPSSMRDAARADGAGHWRTLWQIYVPMSRPAIAAVVVIAFLGRWNDFLWPLIVTNSTQMRTLPIGLSYLRGLEETGTQWPLLMAGSLLVILPVLLLYAVAQRQFVEGITRGAIKG